MKTLTEIARTDGVPISLDAPKGYCDEWLPIRVKGLLSSHDDGV
jgi:hypothetical protein